MFLLYDGIHYDPLAVADPQAPDRPLQTVFSSKDVIRLAEAVTLAEDARKVSPIFELLVFDSSSG